MAALSDYLESGLLNFIFRGQSFSAPSNISIALTSGAPLDSHTGSTIPELASGVDPGHSFLTMAAPAMRTSLRSPICWPCAPTTPPGLLHAIPLECG